MSSDYTFMCKFLSLQKTLQNQRKEFAIWTWIDENVLVLSLEKHLKCDVW